MGEQVTGWCPRCEEYARENERLRELMREVAGSGVEFEDPRVGYVVVQIDRPTWDEVRDVHGGP